MASCSESIFVVSGPMYTFDESRRIESLASVVVSAAAARFFLSETGVRVPAITKAKAANSSIMTDFVLIEPTKLRK